MEKDLLTLLKQYIGPGKRYGIYPGLRDWNGQGDLESWHQSLAMAFDQEREVDVYIHLPFCANLCTFCGLNIQITRDKIKARRYLDQVIEEWQTYLRAFPQLKKQNIYIGGGTPNFFNAQELEQFFGELSLGEFKWKAIELDPRHISVDHLSLFKRWGLDRLNIGVQDFDQFVLAHVNRAFDKKEQLAIIQDAKEMNCFEIALEFIYGLPHQTKESFEQSLELACQLGIEMISLYPLAKVPYLKEAQNAFGDFQIPGDLERQEIYFQANNVFEKYQYGLLGFGHFAHQNSDLYKRLINNQLRRSIFGYVPKHSNVLLGLGNSAISIAPYMYKQNEKIVDKYILPKQRSQHFHQHSQREHHLQIFFEDLTSSPLVNFSPDLITNPALWEQLLADGIIELKNTDQFQFSTIGRHFMKFAGQCFDLY